MSAAASPSGVGEPIGMAVILHGVGSSPEAMLWLAGELERRTPGLATFVPGAPHRFDMGPVGRQWFSIVGITQENRAARVREAQADLVDRIEAEQSKLGICWNRTVVIGFSQGAIISLALAATVDPAPALCVSLGGRLATPFVPASTARGRVLLSHGTSDAVVPFNELSQAAAQLEALGCLVETNVLPGHVHSIVPQQVDVITDAIGRSLPGSDPVFAAAIAS